MKTPFGDVTVNVNRKDGSEVGKDIWIVKVGNEKKFPVDGRFLIETLIVPEMGEEYTFTCSFTPSIDITDEGVETGEWLELKSWYSGLFKWSIGTVDDEWLLAVRKVNANHAEYLEHSVSITISGFTGGKPFMLPFAVAWKETDGTSEQDVLTWLAADPSMMYVPDYMK